MPSVEYTRWNVTSKDFAIIRQHFCNDEIIGYLWQNRGKIEALEEVDAWLWQMVTLAMKQPPAPILAQIISVYKSPEILRQEEMELDKSKRVDEELSELKNPPF